MCILSSVFNLLSFGRVGLSRNSQVEMLRMTSRDIQRCSFRSRSLYPSSPISLGHSPTLLGKVNSNLSILRLILTAT